MSRNFLNMGRCYRGGGFTLLELMLTVVLIAVMSMIGVSSYGTIRERLDNNQAITDIRFIEVVVTRFFTDQGRHPNNLAETDAVNMLDPWGNAYEYTNLADAPKNPVGKPLVPHRMDKNLNPINSDYDLYSMGKNERSVNPLTAIDSRDDIVRAGNGRFVDIAEKY